MQSDPAHEWQRLTRLYGEMSDEELENLAASFGDLTEFAQLILRDEMRKRGLGDPSVKSMPLPSSRPIFGSRNQAIAEQNREFDSPSNTEVEGAQGAHEYTWKTLLCECDGSEYAWQVSEVLRRAGIESWIEGPRSRSEIGLLSPRVLVAADHLDEAKQIIAQPIPQDIIDESKVKVEDFVPPTCPKCGAEDPLLDAVEPTNTWRCENCGAHWSDSGALDTAEPA